MHTFALLTGVIAAVAGVAQAQTPAQSPSGSLHIINQCPHPIYAYEQHITVPDWSSPAYTYRKGDRNASHAIPGGGGAYTHDFFVDNGGMKISLSHAGGPADFFTDGIQQFTYMVRSETGKKVEWAMSDAKGGERFNESSYLQPMGAGVISDQCPQIYCEDGPGCRAYSKQKEDEVIVADAEWDQKENAWHQCNEGTDLWLYLCVTGTA